MSNLSGYLLYYRINQSAIADSIFVTTFVTAEFLVYFVQIKIKDYVCEYVRAVFFVFFKTGRQMAGQYRGKGV